MAQRIWSLMVVAPMACASGSSDAPPEHLHVIVDRLPQCAYGVGYEQPLRIDLLRSGDVVATTYHSGTYTGEESLRVSLHAPGSTAGRYTVRFGRCPSLIEDPAGSVACTNPDWVGRTRARLEPAGMANPRVVEYYRLRARCLE